MQKRYYMKAESTFFQESAHVERSSNKPTLVIIFFVVLFLVIAALGVYYFVSSKNPNGQLGKKQLVSPTVQPTEVPTPVATTEASITPDSLERSKLNVAVLNGSGIGGAARGISANLTKLGYTVARVGNADGFAYTDITIRIKKSKAAYLPSLKKDLETDPEVKKVSTSIVDTLSTDAEVIVGR